MTDSTRPELHLRTLLERTKDGYLLVSGRGIVEHANVAARVILACEAQDPVGGPVQRWFPSLSLTADNPLCETEATMVSAKEDRFTAEVSVVPVDDAVGRYWVFFRDISRRKGMEGSVREHASELERIVTERSRDLKATREKHQHFYDHAPVLDFEIDSEGSIASANRKACLSLGIPVDRLVGLPLADFAVPDEREALVAALGRVRAGSPAPFETRLRSTDGTVLDVALHPADGGSERRGAMRLVGLDTTARREAERLVDQSLELAESQRARMERILRGIGEGVLVTDPDGQVRLMNQIAERFLDIDEQFAFGRDLFSEQRDLDFGAVWRSFLDGGDDIQGCELKLGSRGERIFTVTMSRIRTTEGRPAGIVAVMRNVTRERQIERMKRDFVSNITHELRTPLASIRGFTTTILRGENVGEGDKVRFLQIVEKEAERLQRLIEDLLTISRLEDGRESLNLRTADLTDVLREAHQAFVASAGQRGIELDVDTAGNGAGVFDPDKIRRVIDNLVSNALKYTPAGGRVSLRMAREDNRLAVSVADTGRGIEPELLERIFDRFYTANPAQGNPQGTGLGLHIVRRLLELHGGEVRAESIPGQGTTFRFWFPPVPTAAPVAATRASGPADDLLFDPLADDPFANENGAPAEGAGSAPESAPIDEPDSALPTAGRRSGREFPIAFPARPGAPSLEEALTDDETGPEDDPLGS